MSLARQRAVCRAIERAKAWKRGESCHELIYPIIQQPRSDIEIESLPFQIKARVSFSDADSSF